MGATLSERSSMRGRLRYKLWSSSLLSLLLIAANVGASFRTSALGRSLLPSPCRHAPTRSPVRVPPLAGRRHRRPSLSEVVGLHPNRNGSLRMRTPTNRSSKIPAKLVAAAILTLSILAPPLPAASPKSKKHRSPLDQKAASL